tara:strand:- start:4193 stop:5164 length:972 start_codon:yes stop_codon:yes gene_type:complete
MSDEKTDFLEVDDPIGGQQFVCLSFVSPEDVIQNKEAFKTAKFLQSYAKDKGMKFEEVYEDYLGFQYKFQDEIQRDYDKENKGQTNIRGVKVRGVYSTKEEAESRAKKLHRIDSSFHVFIGQVGYWLPWNPCADKIEDEQFLDSGLNELMAKYKENNINKDLMYEEQKREKMKAAQEEVLAAKKKQKEEEEEAKKLEDKESTVKEVVEEPVEESVEKEKCDICPKNECDNCPEDCPKDVEVNKESINEEDSKLDESLKSSLEDVDPWLQNKINASSSDISASNITEESNEVANEPEPAPEPEPANEVVANEPVKNASDTSCDA